MSMRLKTTLWISLIVFAATAVTFFSGLYFTNSSLKKTMEQDLAFAIGIADSLAGTHMRLMKTEAATVAGRLSAASSAGEMRGLMAEQLEASADISALAVFDRKGVIAGYSVPDHSHDFSQHSGYLEMVYNGETIITSPFFCPQEGGFIMNVYTPMDSGGILAVSFPGLRFSTMLAEHRLWQTGDIFMLNEYGTFIGAADEELVSAMNSYAADSGEDAERAGGGIGALIQTILATDSGVAAYRFEGAARLCAYSRIKDSILGWRVIVTVPLEESPQAGALRGQIYTAVFFLLSGVAAAVFLSRLAMRPFSEIEAQNRDLEKLNATIRAQAAAIQEEHERIKLMFDATPLASRLWSRDFGLIECNEAAVRLFGLTDKQEYLDRYFEFAPEEQPDGQKTRDKIRMAVSEAFENGGYACEWMYRLLDGTPLPSETTFVRVPYEGDYAVAAYSRDLREHKEMMAGIERRDNLLNMVNRTAAILFDTTEDDSPKAVIMESMELLGRSVGADRVHLMQNEVADGQLYFVCKYAWVGDSESTGTAIKVGMRFPYSTDPVWERDQRAGKCFNGPVKDLPEATKNFFASFGIKSMLVIPVFVQDRFWGRVGFSDCGRERFFGEDEVNILRSASLLLAVALNRSVQAAGLREAHKRTRLLINATPLGFNLWDRNFHNMETNDTTVNLFGLKSHEEYLNRFSELSPEYQPDGCLSKEKARRLVDEAFEKGFCQFEWLHRKLDGTPVPSEVTLVRLAYGDDYVVAGYMRDMREYKKMLAAIEQRDNLLRTVNQAADILLRSEPGDFAGTLDECMGMMARAINADRMCLFRNYTENGKLYCTQLHEWSKNVQPFQNTGMTTGVSYDGQIPEIKDILARGECVSALVRDMPPSGRGWFYAQGVLSVLVVPVFLRNVFWGFVSIDNCRSERLFTKNEESIMRSGSLLVVNALLRDEYTRSIQDTSARLETALADAKEANNAKSVFLAHMSHEIRTPLNAVIGLSELTLGEDGLGRGVKSNLEQIYGAGSTILSIVNDILDISKIESGKFEIYPVRYDTPSLVNDTVMLNIVSIAEKAVTFKLHVDENLPGVLYGDDLRVKQIFNNLLSNAFKYTQAGNVEWRISSRPDGDSVWLVSSIEDTGIGIKPEDMRKLFADYNQVGSPSNRRVDGTGLGLAITKRLVDMMDGTLTVESEYGKGSVFRVRIRQGFVSGAPIGKDVAASLMGLRYTLSRRARDTTLIRVDLSYANVLVVDDLATNLDVVKGMMRPYQVNVDCATSGRQAVRMIRSESPRYDAVFMDHMMPGMDGIETTRIIREEIGTEYARTIPIIALTANAIAGNEEMFLKQGFQDFISKPIDIMRLDSVLRRWVRDKNLEKKLSDAEADGAENPGGNAASLLEGITIIGVDIGKALERFSGSETALIDVLRSYTVNTPPLMRALRDFLAAENFEDYAIVIHGIKGSSYSIFAREAGGAAEALELAAKAGNFDVVKKGHEGFEKLTGNLLAGLETALAKIDSVARKPAAAPDPALLAELRAACEAFDMDRIDTAMARLEAFRYESGGAIVPWLRKHVNTMAFDEILRGEWPARILA